MNDVPDAVPRGRGGSRRPVSRRDALGVIGTGATTLLVAGVGLGGYRVFDSAALHPGGGTAYDPWQHWRDSPGPLGAVAAALLAANPHNTQPWRFEVTAATVDVLLDPDRDSGALDPLHREQHVGLGCALENLVLGCLSRGLRPTVVLMPDGPGGPRVAHLDLVTTEPQQDDRHDAIGSRHTNRGPYTRRALSRETLDALVDTTGLTGVGVTWITEPAPMAAMGRLLVDAAQAVADDDRQSRDGFVWFRGDDHAVQTHRDGLTLDGQGLSPLVLGAAKLLPVSSRSAGDTFWVDQTRDVHTATAAAYGVLTAAEPDDRVTQLRTGRLLQRIHLTATARGVALQHMNQVTERVDAEQAAGGTAVFGPRLGDLLPPGSRPLVAFRVGRPVRDGRPSPRRPVAAVVGGPR